MGTFAVTDPSQLLDATNYLLSNLGQSTQGGNVGNAVTINTQTGVIGQGGTIIGYFYQYLNIAYADSSDGTTNFSRSRFNNAQYYGVYNNNADPSPNLTNPANYQWTEITGGLSTNKYVFYSTLGGRQIQFIIATTLPGTGYVQAQDLTAIDLDFVTNSASLPVIIATAYYNAANANVAPATPTGGTYDFGNLIFTAPAGWSNSIPANNIAFFSSQNTFEATGNGIGTVGPSFAWTVPVLTGKLGQDGTNGANGANGTNGVNGSNGVSTYFYNVFQSSNVTPSTPTGGFYNFATSVGTPPTGWSNTPSSPLGDPIYAVSTQVSSTNPTANVSIGNDWSAPFQYTGAGGAPGQRGFVPMAYVLTPSDPRVASNVTLSQWFQANTSGTPDGSGSPPVGTGFIPVDKDTASFTWSANTAVAPVYTYYGNTSTWAPAMGQVINGNVFVTGSVNSSKLNSNDVYTLRLQSTNANIGNNSSNGFWFDSLTGNARMAGNVSIGNNLTVGNNAVIGNSLTIGGVLLNGALVANVVTPGTIAPNAVTAGTIAANAVTANTIAANAVIAGAIAANAVIAGTIAAGAVTTGTLAANLVISNDIQSTGATIGNISSPGYWLQGNSGNARFGGNVWIGSNLNVSGLITTSGLIANTVATATIQPDAVTASQVVQIQGVIGAVNLFSINSSTDFYAGGMVGNSFSSSGTVVSTTAGTSVLDLMAGWIEGANVQVFTAGTGAFAPNSYITSINNYQSFNVNATPTTPLNGSAGVYALCNFGDPTSPYDFAITTDASDAVTISATAVIQSRYITTALASGVYADFVLVCKLYRSDYTPLGVPTTAPKQLIYTQAFNGPQSYVNGAPYLSTQLVSMANILDYPGAPGTYVYYLSYSWEPQAGSVRMIQLLLGQYNMTTTVLKR